MKLTKNNNQKNSKKYYNATYLSVWTDLREVNDVNEYPNEWTEYSLDTIDNFYIRNGQTQISTIMDRYDIFKDDDSLRYYLIDSRLNRPLGVMEFFDEPNKKNNIYNVFLKDEVRGQGIGYFFYKAIIHDLGYVVSADDLTVDSRRVWIKLLRDSEIKVEVHSVIDGRVFTSSEISVENDYIDVPGYQREDLIIYAISDK